MTLTKMDKKDRRGTFQSVVSTLQLAVLVVGVGSVFMSLGRKDEQINTTINNLNQMEGIVQDLLKSQVEGASKDSEHDRILEDLKERIGHLERTRNE